MGAVFVASAAGIWVVFRDWRSGLFGLIFALVGFCMLTEEYTQIDADTRKLTQETRLFGRYRLWLRCYHLSEFTLVVLQRTYDKEVGSDSVCVGLQRRSGGFFQIRYFPYAVRGQPCVEAEKFAHSLAELTGLRLHGKARSCGGGDGDGNSGNGGDGEV